MNKTDINTEKIENGKSFTRRLDFYWKYIAVYAIAIILYALIKGSLADRTLTFTLLDPVVILLAVFIVLTAVGLFVETSKKKEIIIGEDFVIFSNRFRKRTFTKEDIARIFIGREYAKYTGKFRIIKIKLKIRKRPLIIRPSSYWSERELTSAFIKLKRNISHR